MESFLYQTLHLCGGEVRCLNEHLRLLDRCARALYGCACPLDPEPLRRRILRIAEEAHYPHTLSGFVRLEITESGAERLLPAGVSYYAGYALRSVQPDGLTIPYALPWEGAPTAAREAAAALARRMAERAGAQVAVQVREDGRCRSVEGAPMAVVKDYAVRLVPEGSAAELRCDRLAGGHTVCRFAPPRSVEYDLLARAVRRAGLTLEEGEAGPEMLAGADEIFWLDYRGITALGRCNGRPLMALIAQRVAEALESLFSSNE